MAGTSYCLTDNLKLDVGYRYSHVNGGRMFELAPVTGPGAGPGFDDGFNVHEARAGLRYQFGGDTGCGLRSGPLRAGHAGLQIVHDPSPNCDRPAQRRAVFVCRPGLQSNIAKKAGNRLLSLTAT